MKNQPIKIKDKTLRSIVRKNKRTEIKKDFFELLKRAAKTKTKS